MMKIDYEKVEQNLSKTMHKMFVGKLVAGKPVAYPRAIAFYGHNVKKPDPPDSVVESLDEMRMELAASGETLDPQSQQEAAPAVSEAELAPGASAALAPPSYEHLKAPQSVEPDPIPAEEPVYISPLFILRKHLLWFIRKRVANIYKLLGTTKEEIIAFRKKKELTTADLHRVQEILIKAQEINRRLLKKIGLETDDAIIEKEKRKHVTRRFNIRDSWIPL